ncbi:DNA helicase II (UvrD) related protein [Thermoplasma acidophilum]|uniref:DNA 3'-5' helicase n=1 Tax=Thermoplasma acidophilum (strain ATCC 25905 / DSM 1728 / JCM 9062 / NBRC 15155 / AMRC-C165) TaxID=273075 RepID=Q9HJG8_THEAC|nr:DNA helicase II (UvrD) related protein [Thermoplasma acidophilum]
MNANVVIAGPGTGKTTSISQKYLELVQSGVDPNDILCITFTNKAAENMRSRIIKALERSGTQIDLSVINVYTFHSFANSAIRRYGYRGIVNQNFLRKIIFDYLIRNSVFNYEREYLISRIVPQLENIIRYLGSFGIDRIENPEETAASLREIFKKRREEKKIKEDLEEITAIFIHLSKIMDEYRNAKEARGVIDYNDMIIKFLELEKKPHFKYVLVDELQDASDLQARLIKSVADDIYAVGDRKQAIFGFQGGGFGNFSNHFPDAHVNYLLTDHRNSEAVLNYAREFFLKNTKYPDQYRTELDQLKASKARGGSVEVVSGEEEAVLDLLKRFPEGKVGILARRNDQVIKISEILDSNGMRYASSALSAASDRAKKDVIAFLKMIIYGDMQSVIDALFTPFSGLQISEAYDIKESLISGNTSLQNYDLLNNLRRTYSAPGINGLIDMFEKLIIPIALAFDQRYFLTVERIYKNLREYLDFYGNEDRSDLINYLEICDDEVQEIDADERISVLTVHKAKGLEFDHVIYLPKAKKDEKMSAVDLVAEQMIRLKTGRDISVDLEDEDTRVDFVAITRAAQNLVIVSDDERYLNRFSMKGGSITASTSTMSKDYYDIKREPYLAFVRGDLKHASDMIHEEGRIRKLIYSGIRKNNVISFSLLASLEDPFRFLKDHILGLKYTSPAMGFGTSIHSIAQDVFEGNVQAEQIPERLRPYYWNILNIMKKIQDVYGMSQIGSELEVKIPGSAYMREADAFILYGRIDAVFSDGEKYLIVDYKTDKRKNSGNHYGDQLAFYRMLYSKANHIDPSRVKTAIAYIGLRPGVNTGRIDWDLYPMEKNDSKIRDLIRKYVQYCTDPEAFIDDLISMGPDRTEDTLYDRIVAILTAGSKL